MRFGGTWKRIPRTPFVLVDDPDLLQAGPGDPFTGRFWVSMADLRPPQRILWWPEVLRPSEDSPLVLTGVPWADVSW